MANKKFNWKETLKKIRGLDDDEKEYISAKAEFIAYFTENAAAYFCEIFMAEKPEENRKRLMQEFSSNSKYNSYVHFFFDDMIDWYFHYYNGNTIPYLNYERMKHYGMTKEKPIPSIEDSKAEYFEQLKIDFPQKSEKKLMKIAEESAIENYEFAIERRDEERNWSKLVKSHITPAIIDADFLPGIAYREMELMAYELQLCVNDDLNTLEYHIRQNSVKTIDKQHKQTV